MFEVAAGLPQGLGENLSIGGVAEHVDIGSGHGEAERESSGNMGIEAGEPRQDAARRQCRMPIGQRWASR
jgi:hypothetical protein